WNVPNPRAPLAERSRARAFSPVRRRLSASVINTAPIDLPTRLIACALGVFHVDVSVVLVAQATRNVRPVASAVTGLALIMAAPFVRAPLPVARSAQIPLAQRIVTCVGDDSPRRRPSLGGNSSCQHTFGAGNTNR